MTNGEAELECRVLAGGVLEACKITSETPTGFDFGPAAKRMAERRRILAKDVPLTREGLIIVRVPFDPKTPATISPLGCERHPAEPRLICQSACEG